MSPLYRSSNKGEIILFLKLNLLPLIESSRPEDSMQSTIKPRQAHMSKVKCVLKGQYSPLMVDHPYTQLITAGPTALSSLP
jgi:hypothetical protein